MVDNIPLSLQALPKTDRTTESLPFLISCINEQRGSFRNVTEESLEAEIRNLEALKSEEVEDSSDDDDVQDEKSRRDQLAPAREDMLRQVT